MVTRLGRWGLLLALVLVLGAAWAGEIHDAAKAGDTVKLEALLKADDKLLTAKDDNGLTPLHWAAAAGKISVVQLLLDKGADVNAVDTSGRTPLHGAAGNGQKDIIEKLLLPKGAKLDARDNTDATPLYYAVTNGKPEMAEFLLYKKADVNARTKSNYTPMQAALEKKDAKLIAVLKKFNGRPTLLNFPEVRNLATVALAANSKYVAAAGKNRTVYLWETQTGTPVWGLTGHAGEITVLAFKSDASAIQAVDANGELRVWDVKTGALLKAVQGTRAPVAIAANSRQVTSLAPGMAMVWDAGSGEILHRLPLGMVNALVYSTDGQLGASATQDGKLQLWDPVNGRISLAWPDTYRAPVSVVALSADRRMIASGGASPAICVYSVPGGILQLTLTGHTGTVTAIAFAPDNAVAASGGEDGTVRLWDVKTGNPLFTLTGPGGAITAVAFSADGKLLACSARDGARVWTMKF
ncbi:MAG: ankyrin repeat domain-containing protein [Armatimonadota bacterium]